MPTHMNRPFPTEQLRGATLAPPFDFTRGVPTLKVPALRNDQRSDDAAGDYFLAPASALYDLKDDYTQNRPIDDAQVVERLMAEAQAVMRAHDAPAESFTRLGINP
jgi:hypothetical protein